MVLSLGPRGSRVDVLKSFKGLVRYETKGVDVIPLPFSWVKDPNDTSHLLKYLSVRESFKVNTTNRELVVGVWRLMYVSDTFFDPYPLCHPLFCM